MRGRVGEKCLSFFHFFFSYFSYPLDEGRVQHDTNTAAHCVGGKVGTEGSIHHSRVSVYLLHPLTSLFA